MNAIDKLKKFNFNEDVFQPLDQSILKPVIKGDLKAILLYTVLPALILLIITAIVITLIVNNKSTAVDPRMRQKPQAVSEKNGKYFEFSFGDQNKYSIYRIVEDGNTRYELAGYDFFNKVEIKELIGFEKNNDNSYSFQININNSPIEFEVKENQVEFYLIVEKQNNDDRSSDAGSEKKMPLQSFGKINEILKEDKKAINVQEKFVLDTAQILIGQKIVDPRFTEIKDKIQKQKTPLTKEEQRILKENISVPFRNKTAVSTDDTNTKNPLSAHHDKTVEELKNFKATLADQIKGMTPNNQLGTAKNNFMEWAKLSDESDRLTVRTGKTTRSSTKKEVVLPKYDNKINSTQCWVKSNNDLSAISETSSDSSFDESESLSNNNQMIINALDEKIYPKSFDLTGGIVTRKDSSNVRLARQVINTETGSEISQKITDNVGTAELPPSSIPQSHLGGGVPPPPPPPLPQSHLGGGVPPPPPIFTVNTKAKQIIEAGTLVSHNALLNEIKNSGIKKLKTTEQRKAENAKRVGVIKNNASAAQNNNTTSESFADAIKVALAQRSIFINGKRDDNGSDVNDDWNDDTTSTSQNITSATTLGSKKK